MENLDEREQIEAIAGWWKRNGVAILMGLGLGLAGVLGWQFWQSWHQGVAESASATYQEARQALGENNVEQARVLTDALIAEQPGTPYAGLAALSMAGQEIQDNNLEAARERLDWVVANASQPELQEIARIRLARVLLALDEYEAALAPLDVVGKSFAAEVGELKGDIYRAMGDPDKARDAYQSAMSTLMLSGGDQRWLQMKLDDLAISAEQVGG